MMDELTLARMYAEAGFSMDDVQIDVFAENAAAPEVRTAVRVTYLPTGQAASSREYDTVEANAQKAIDRLVEVIAWPAGRRGVNLGCGRIIMPTAKPGHHHMLPDELYTDRGITWDNVDQFAMPGVSHAFDLMRYPWPLEDDSYDVALATHILEHIPHGIIRHGQLESLTGGWWAWWGELGRIMRPGGTLYFIAPYAGSRSATCDPTHTRYLMPATFGYFTKNPTAPFDYHLDYEWETVYGVMLSFTQLIIERAQQKGITLETKDSWLLSKGLHHVDVVEDFAMGLRIKK